MTTTTAAQWHRCARLTARLRRIVIALAHDDWTQAADADAALDALADLIDTETSRLTTKTLRRELAAKQRQDRKDR